ncbi:MAG: repeat-associated core domain protein, partial [Myxococcales bacterium]|nr:repeat-associated core domain protein [Myxococcales bacterium]
AVSALATSDAYANFVSGDQHGFSSPEEYVKAALLGGAIGGVAGGLTEHLSTGSSEYLPKGHTNELSATSSATDAFTPVERSVITEAQAILKASVFEKIRLAHTTGESVVIEVDGVTIQYEPGLPASGMTMFGENGFLVGPDAFTSPSELTKTVLHELHRLRTSASSEGVSGDLATQETKSAFDFAEKASREIR